MTVPQLVVYVLAVVGAITVSKFVFLITGAIIDRRLERKASRELDVSDQITKDNAWLESQNTDQRL